MSMATPAAAILFPGQGAQSLGMGLDIAEGEASARAVFEVAADVLGTDLREVIGGDDQSALDRTDVCQPAILMTSLATLAAAEVRGLIDPTRVRACAGLSLGEYTALAWSGALQLEDALRLVQARGRAMQRASDENESGMMSLVGATEESASAVVEAAREEDVLVVANLLAPGQVAIAGSLPALDRAETMLRDHKIRKGVRLPVAGAFHSPCMESAASALQEALDSTPFRAPRMPVVMNVTGEPTDDPDIMRELLQKQITSPVLWQRSMETLIQSGVRQYFEPAPGKQLTNMLRRYESPQDGDLAVTVCGDLTQLDGLSPCPASAATTGEAS